MIIELFNRIEDSVGDTLEVGKLFTNEGEVYLGVEEKDDTCSVLLTVNQVENLVSHLQRALDEHGDKTQ